MPAVVAERAVRLNNPPIQSGSAGVSGGEVFGGDQGGLLFKQVTPRRRQDQFGRDSTRHADYLLSMAVFPTGVRTPLLGDLQRKTEHQCGFEVIDKGTERRHVYIQDGKPDSSRRGSATDSAKKPPPNTPMTASAKMSCDRGTHHSQSVSMPPSSRRSYSTELRRWVRSSDGGTRSSSTGAGESKVKDIRDPLYLNTYCPDERKLRYKKTSLPRISNRSRPWTVSEPNPSYRFGRNSHDAATRAHKSAWPPGPRHGNFRINARDVNALTKSRSVANNPDGIDPDEDEMEEDTTSMTGSQALLEVKSYFPSDADAIGDQRDTLRGKQGCLHAKVKQCIKFVKYREKLARSNSVERPMKQEGGRYRPFSTTTIRTPRAAPAAAPIPRHPDPTSVEIYKEYIDTIALQTRLVSAADKRRRPRQPVSGAPRYNTAASSYQDGNTSAQQSVADSSRPTPSNGSVTEKTSRPSESGLNSGFQPTSVSTTVPGDRVRDKDPSGGGDPRGVRQVLDIIRLSPKAQPPRTSRTSRGGRSYRAEEDKEEGKDERENGRESPAKTHAIFLPNVSKSATTSVCSFPDEQVNAAET